jgi:hypothetical protein
MKNSCTHEEFERILKKGMNKTATKKTREV